MSALNVVCPRCGGGIPSTELIGKYPGAASRYNSDIEVCSQCGTEEAMLQFSKSGEGRAEQERIVHPVFGAKLWETIPQLF